MPLDPIAAIQTSLGINRKATILTMGGFVVMATAIGIAQMADDDTLTFWQLLAGLLGLIVLMMILTQLPVLARRLLGWVLALCFSFIMVTATLQTVTENRFRPPLALASCIISFYFAESCHSSTADTSSLELSLVGAAFAQTSTDAAEVPPLTGAELAAAQANASVFIQFAGFARSDVVTLATGLAGAGWKVEGADRGGERIASAIGLNEVRYFNPQDAALAAALAGALRTAFPGKEIAVRDLTATKFGSDAPGHLEIWASE